MMDRPRIIELPKIIDRRGNLSFVQNGDGRLPFDIARVFWIYDVPAGELRGGHAHHRERQVLVAVSGSVRVNIFDGGEWETFTLNSPYRGLYIPASCWRTMDGFSSGTALLAFSSLAYDESDYIRDFDKFLKLASSR